MTARASFTRSAPDARRQELIEACARCLAERGASGTSVRAICAAAGVSPGLLTHYFDGIADLIAATYVHAGEQVGGALNRAMEDAGRAPRARLEAYVTASFRPPVSDPRLLATWLAFWSLVKTDPAIARLHGDVYADYRRTLEELLGACGVAASDLRLHAIAISALVDGLWLEHSLDATTFTADEAARIARRWIDALVG